MSKPSRITARLQMSIRDRKRRKIPGFLPSIDIPARIKRGIPGATAPPKFHERRPSAGLEAGKKSFLFWMPCEST
jgi:hypothetical protein